MAQATATNSTVFNRAAIMRAAWRHYRNTYEMFGKPKFDRNGFRWAMQMAWFEAKKAARLAAVPAEVKQARAEAIRAEIDGLKYKSFQINTAPMHDRLTAELRSLAA